MGYVRLFYEHMMIRLAAPVCICFTTLNFPPSVESQWEPPNQSSITTVDRPFSWRQTNGPYGGAISAMASDPGGKLYVATQASYGSSIIFRSTDDGSSWINVLQCDGGYSGITALTSSPRGKIYAGGYWYSASDGFHYGVLRSTNLGTAWERIIINSIFSITSIVSDSLDDVVAGTFGDGIVRSSDRGSTWTH